MKTGRNDPCPCGRGKKYKYCCLSQASVANIENTQIENDAFRLTKTNHVKKHLKNGVGKTIFSQHFFKTCITEYQTVGALN